MKTLVLVAAAVALAANVAFAAPSSYRTRPTLDGYATEKHGRKVFHHYNSRLGGYPAPRCYTSGNRTDCYWRQPVLRGRVYR